MIVRSMAERDAAAAAELAMQLGYPATAEQITRRLAAIANGSPAEAAEAAVFVAETDDGRVVGWVHVHASRLLVVEPAAEIWGLVVDAEARGEGVGRRLMAEAEAWAAARGLDRLRLRSNVVREGAHAFYRRLGYEVVKTSLTFERRLP